jgi:hypothetical protein
LTNEARARLNEYMREYRKKHRDKIKQYHENYWEKKAKETEPKGENENG